MKEPLLAMEGPALATKHPLPDIHIYIYIYDNTHPCDLASLEMIGQTEKQQKHKIAKQQNNKTVKQ